MTTEPLADAGDARADRPAAGRHRRRAGPVTARRRRTVRAAGERRAHPRHRIVVRRDRHRAHRGRPADPRQRRRVAGRAPRPDRRDRARGRRPGPPALDRARSSTRRGPTPAASWDDVEAVAVTYGPGLAGSLLVGINFAKALAWVHDKPLVGVNHLEGHVYAAWLLDPGEADRPDPVFPLVALVVSGGHTFLAEMRDHLTYRLLGTTVDDAAGEAFDKVGRLLGPRLPGRAGDRTGRRGRDPPRPRLPAGVARRLVRLQLLGAQDGRPPDRRPRPAPTPAWPTTPEAPLPDDVVAELAWGFQDAVVDVLVDEDDPGGRARSARARSCSAAASPPTAPCARGWPARPRRSGLPLIVPRPALCTDNGAMIGAAGARRFAAGERAGLDLDARPSLPLAAR